MTDVYLCGHGHWRTVGLNEPFTMLPKGTKLSVYTPVGRYLDPGCAYATITGDTSAGGIVFTPDQTFEEFRSCPNATLLPLNPGKDKVYIDVFTMAANKGKQICQVNTATRLSALLEQYKGAHLHWMACRPRLGDKSVSEGGFNDDYLPDFGLMGGIPEQLSDK